MKKVEGFYYDGWCIAYKNYYMYFMPFPNGAVYVFDSWASRYESLDSALPRFVRGSTC